MAASSGARRGCWPSVSSSAVSFLTLASRLLSWDGFRRSEHGWCVAQTGAVDGELYPVFNGRVFGLAHTPDVAGSTSCCIRTTCCINDLNLTVGFDFEGFIVRTVFFGCLRHQTDVGHGTHGCRIERRVRGRSRWLPDKRLRSCCRESRLWCCVCRLCPTAAGVADHRGHGSIDDDVAGGRRLVMPLSESTIAKSGLAA